MASIQKLSTQLIGLIAAGEVVERPASAIKELVENSIDADATQITVDITDGGLTSIRVSDNGKGIPTSEIKMAFERHATSKISKEDDLFAMHTLGFRGEALASISAVSKVTLTTKQKDDVSGTKTRVQGGEWVDIAQAAAQTGTTILVKDLFFNTPVRKKFLKKPATEASLVADFMMRLMLSNPQIRFRFVSDGKTIYQSTGDGKLSSALISLYGLDTFKQMREVSGMGAGIRLHGYVGVESLSRGNRMHQSFFVNGRYFKSTILSNALQEGTQERVMVGRFPICAIFIEIDPQSVDVNVHPNKLEVRFAREKEIAQTVTDCVKEALQEDSLAKQMTTPTETTKQEEPKPKFKVVSFGNTSNTANTEVSLAVENLDMPIRTLHQSETPLTQFKQQLTSKISFDELENYIAPNKEISKTMETTYAPTINNNIKPVPVSNPIPVIKPIPVVSPSEQTSYIEPKANLRFIGVVFNTYCLFEIDNTVLLVDQHAAHERMLYDRFLSELKQENISQMLLSPILISLPAQEVLQITANLHFFKELGFELDFFDTTHIALHGVPHFFGADLDPKNLFMQALDGFQNDKPNALQEMLKKRVLQMACKHAIKAGDVLNETALFTFIEMLCNNNHFPTCPHGRPIVVKMSRNELDKRFKRIP